MNPKINSINANLIIWKNLEKIRKKLNWNHNEISTNLNISTKDYLNLSSNISKVLNLKENNNFQTLK